MSRTQNLTILTHVPLPLVERIDARIPGLRWVEVPRKGEVPPDVRGEVLFTFTTEVETLRETLTRGVRWIQTMGTGVDHFPLGAVGERTLTCARGASSVPIAEWVMAVVLAHAKRLPEMWLSEPAERWNMAGLDGLAGAKLGLVGIGTIGQEVARRALAFGMEIRAVRRSAAPSPLEGVAVSTSLHEVIGWADHLVVAAAATTDTRHLIDEPALAAAKQGLHLVNVSRGSLVDQEALRAALDAGRVARASLDTVEPEPLPEGHWMYAHPKVFVSAHISWSAPGSVEALADAFADNLERWLAGEPLQHVVDVEAGY